MNFLRKPMLAFTVAIVLVVSLPLLAWFQYQWLGRLSENEHERMRSNLKISADKLTEEFDTELARVLFAFSGMVTPGESRGSDENEEFAESFRLWKDAAPHPDLIETVYLVWPDGSDFRLQRFDPEEALFVTDKWAGGLDAVRPHLVDDRTYSRMSAAGGLPLGLDESLITDPLAIVVPRIEVQRNQIKFEDQELHEVRISQILRGFQLSGWLLIKLDQDFIEDEFLPELIDRHFSDGSGSDYRVGIVAQDDPEDVFFRSDPEVQTQVTSMPDATSTIFNLQRELHLMWAFDSTREGPFRIRASGIPVPRVVGRRSSDLTFSAELMDERLTGSGDDAVVEVRSFASTSPTPGWQLVAQHRAGSLEAAVDDARFRNLMISLSVLMTLGASMILILVSTQRAQRLAQQQVDFVANVSHELRTPVAVISSAGENLKDGLIDDPEKARRYGAVIRAEARRLSALVEQVMDFAGMQSGKQRYEMRPVALDRLIDAAIADSMPQMKEQGFSLDKNVSHELPAIMADPTAMRSVVTNLLNNAMKYCGSQQWARSAPPTSRRPGVLKWRSGSKIMESVLESTRSRTFSSRFTGAVSLWIRRSTETGLD
jgi:signal transduction histidine kinase